MIDITLWSYLPNQIVLYVGAFAVWLVGAWIVLWAAEEGHTDKGNVIAIAALWPLVLVLGMGTAVITSPFWVPKVSYDYFIRPNDYPP